METFAIFETGSGKWVDTETQLEQRAIYTSNRRRALELSRDDIMMLIALIPELRWLHERGTLMVFTADRYMPDLETINSIRHSC